MEGVEDEKLIPISVSLIRRRKELLVRYLNLVARMRKFWVVMIIY